MESLLKQHASGVYRLVAARPDSALIFSTYPEVCEKGALIESPVKREAGVSFTPKPARLLQILLKEHPSVSTVELLLALWLVSSADPSDLVLKTPLTLYRTQNKISPELASPLAALVLDQIRHLHMTELSPEERIATLTRICASDLSKDAPDRLLTVCTAAKERFLKYCVAA